MPLIFIKRTQWQKLKSRGSMKPQALLRIISDPDFTSLIIPKARLPLDCMSQKTLPCKSNAFHPEHYDLQKVFCFCRELIKVFVTFLSALCLSFFSILNQNPNILVIIWMRKYLSSQTHTHTHTPQCFSTVFIVCFKQGQHISHTY